MKRAQTKNRTQRASGASKSRGQKVSGNKGAESMKDTAIEIKFASLLNEAVSQPGLIARHYSAFHRYSLGNQVAAIFQCMAMGVEIGPIASFYSWKEKGRAVVKGAKAIMLCMPVTRKFEKENSETGETEEGMYRRFFWKRNWFVLSQTDGADYTEDLATPDWVAANAMKSLEISKVSFSHPDGNCQGYAHKREIAINPLAGFPLKTTIHEMAHIVLGHTAEAQMADTERLPRDVREVEAEGVAYILTDLLGLPGKTESRGYIQSWLQDGEITEKSAQRIFTAADKIFRAGNC